MAREIKFEGRKIVVPDDATDAEIAEILSGSSPAPTRKPLSKPEPLSFGEELALGADKLISKLPLVGNKQLRQEAIDLASGAASSYRNIADVVSPGAGEKLFPSSMSSGSGWETVGQIVDPVATVTGAKAYQLASKVAPAMGALKKAGVTGAAAGTAVSLPQAASQARQGRLGEATGTVGGGALAGAIVGPVLTGVGLGAGKIADLANRWQGGAKQQVVDYLDDLFQGDKVKVTAALDELQGFVPGEKPTAGLAAVSGEARFPQLKALEQDARTSPTTGDEFADRDVANKAARIRPLEQMAEPGKRYFDPITGEVIPSSQELLRTRVTEPLFNIANKDVIPITPDIQDIVKVSPPASPAQPNPFAGVGVEAPQTFMPQYAGKTIAELQQIKNELTTRIKALEGATDGQSKLTLDALRDQRTALDAAMRKGSGTYAVASDIFRNYSAPLNQAKVAEELAGALKSPSKIERTGTFLSALEKAPRNANVQDLGQIMTPEQMATIEALRGSALREQAYNDLDNVRLPRMTSVAQEIEQQVPNYLSSVISTARSVLRRAGGYSDEQAQKILDQAMLDPAALSQLLKMLPSAEMKSQVRTALGNVYNNPVARTAVISSALRTGE